MRVFKLAKSESGTNFAIFAALSAAFSKSASFGVATVDAPSVIGLGM
jgi:hypothetical protein